MVSIIEEMIVLKLRQFSLKCEKMCEKISESSCMHIAIL
jgi:hypothetical protein